MDRPERALAIAGVVAALSLVALAAADRAAADSWLPPTTTSYLTSDGEFRFTVVPRRLTSTLDYFRGLENNAPLPGQDPEGPSSCKGILEKREAGGGYRAVWEAALSNPESPVRAVVAPDGRYVVTFDDWYSVGYGDNVVAIYGSDGRMIRRLGLTDLMSEEAIRTLPHSVSSIWWGGDHRIGDGETLVLAIVANRKFPFEGEAEFRYLSIDLATGQVM